MTPQEFINKWQAVTLSERSACQQHFLDLCELLGQPKPAAADPEGAWYTFERGVRTITGGSGWADVWMQGRFGWEYKRKHRDLEAAYQQLLRYREDLDNPPLLVVCDMNRFQIHTNFTGTAKKIYEFDLDGLPNPRNLDLLRKLFTEPEALKPGETTASITERAAKEFAILADGMRDRGIEAHRAAHFLMKLMFCMFAEDIRLLPDKLFKKVLSGTKNDPKRSASLLKSLFEAMCSGGMFGVDDILHFNGGLFKDADVIELTPAEIGVLIKVNEGDWSNVEPSIFGTLFERTLDPAKRSQIGAHYTSRRDIETLLNPVMMNPLRREWEAVKKNCEMKWKKGIAIVPVSANLGAKRVLKSKAPKKATGAKAAHDRLLLDFVERLSDVKVLDPACGSGNFLYVAIHLLLDLEKEVISYAAKRQLGLLPQIRPTQLSGIEINPYAQELAQVVIWIGYLQWMYHNGFQPPHNPVLEPFESIVNKDAILDFSDTENPKEADWPTADFIVGNPPFLGGSLVRSRLGDEYVKALFSLYKDRIPGFSDLCCYWFEKARAAIDVNPDVRVGLLATQGIRGGANRTVLTRIKKTGDIFFGLSDRNWILDGASVHVSMVGFDDGRDRERVLDSVDVESIPADLSLGTDVTSARCISGDDSFYDEGTKKGARFELTDAEWYELVNEANPNGRPNSDVLRAYMSGNKLYKGVLPSWIIYFPAEWTIEQAAAYEAPFEFVKKFVFPKYGTNRKKWWAHERPRPKLVPALDQISRYFATVRVSKHRIFVWLDAVVLPDSSLGVFAKPEDFRFGVLHSRIHEVWSLAQGTQVRDRKSGFRYTPTSCLDTFPFPELMKSQREMIADAAQELNSMRNNWLTPPEWTQKEVLEFFGSVEGPWKRYVTGAIDQGIGTVQYPRVVAKSNDCAKKLKLRTLTNLYNDRPTWLNLAHRKLDEAVFEAYGWDPNISDNQLLAELLKLNMERAKEKTSFNSAG